MKLSHVSEATSCRYHFKLVAFDGLDWSPPQNAVIECISSILERLNANFDTGFESLRALSEFARGCENIIQWESLYEPLPRRAE